jgi:predicted TIM-barrel fold metal-dependent hydrolase
MSKPRFVDPHVHLWELATGWYPHLDGDDEATEDHGVGDFSKLRGRDFTLGNYFDLARDYDVLKIIHITAAQTPPTWPDETRYMQDLFERHGFPNGIIGWTDFTRPVADVDKELAEHAESPNFRGVRHHDGINLRSDHSAKCFEAMQRRGLIYDVVVHEYDLPDAAKLAHRFEGMSWIVEHTGWPTATDPETFDTWRRGMDMMAACPNAAVKIGGLSMFMHRWTTDDFRPWIEAAIDAFGTDRCMFASNFPVDWLYSEFGTLMNAFSEITRQFSEEERNALFVTNAERWYRI